MNDRSAVFTEFISKYLNSKKSMNIIIAVFAVCVLLVIYMSFGGPGDVTEARSKNEGSDATFAQSEESKLEQILSKIAGAGSVSVMITYESTPERVVASNDETQQSTVNSDSNQSNTQSTSKSAVTVQGRDGNEPLIIKENQPEIRGVIVIARGGDDIHVRMELVKAVQTVLRVEAKKVEVFTMKYKE